jgi:hypothetical protein
MQHFRTVFSPARAAFTVRHTDRLLLIGSCFTEHISQKLFDRKFSLFVNPFGITYNPISIAECLRMLFNKNEYFTEEDIFEYDGLWHNWQHHGKYSEPEADLALNGINMCLEHSQERLLRCNRLLITFGTADVFTLRETGKIVANNHKMPITHFTERRLTVSEIVDNLGQILAQLLARQPDLQVVLTVSPVRHARRGMVENQRSKAVLLLACAELASQLVRTTYFPAYELLMDDLRDYRFYADDMLHPAPAAIDYIWHAFTQTYFDTGTQSLCAEIERIIAAAQHRPLHPNTPQHRAFQAQQLAKIKVLQSRFPNLDFEMEIMQLNRWY